jgi:cytochrome P450
MPAGQRLKPAQSAQAMRETYSADSAARGATMAFDIRKLTADFLDNPHPTYQALRQFDPVHRMPDGSYFLTRYDDCLKVYHETATWSSDKKLDFQPNFADSLLYEHHTTSLVFNDPPYHTRVRKLLAPAFTPRALRALQTRIESLVDRLLESAASRGQIDLISDFAAAIPIQLIGDMLGIPQGEREPLRDWSLAILGALEPVLTRDQFDTGVKAVAEFKVYLDEIVAHRAKSGESDQTEILSKLIAGTDLCSDIKSDDKLSKLELIHNCIFLLNAGHETTTNLIGNGIDLLIRHPDAMRDLRAHPEAVETAVEEFLRMESSNQLGNRRAVKDTVLGGIAMPPGTYVHIAIGAANRDPAQFPDPDGLDVRRQPNRHLAFGTGIHACAGMSLARMEAQVAINRLLKRFDRIEPAGAFVRSGRARFRGFKSYPVRVSNAGAA